MSIAGGIVLSKNTIDRNLYVYDTIWFYSYIDSSTGKYYSYCLSSIEDEMFQVCMKNPRYIDFRVFCKHAIYPFFI